MAPPTASEAVFDGRLTRHQHIALMAVALLALALRAIYLWGQAQHNPFFEVVRGDAYDHHAWAQAIAFGPGMDPEPYYRAPLYYYLLAALYSAVGPSIVAARLAGACIGALTVYAIGRLGAGLAGYRAGLFAGLLAAAYWPAIYFDGELLTVGLESLLEVCLLLLLLSATRRNSMGGLALAGAALGLCALARPNFLALAPAVVVWLFIALPGARFAGRKWLASGLLLVTAASVIAPVAIRNARFSDPPVLITYSAGVNFFIGNNPDSDGISAVLPGARRSLRGGYEDARRIPESELGRGLAPAEVSEYWLGRGLDWLRADPVAFGKHLIHKLRLFWSPVELPNNQPIRFFAGLSPIAAGFWLGFPVLAILGLAGFVILIRDGKRWFLPALFLLLYTGTVVLFFSNARYRLPVYPLLAVAAGAGLSRALQFVVEDQRRPLALYGLSAGVAALVLATNPPSDRDAFHQANRGEGHKALGELVATAPLSDREAHARALAHFEEAVELKPGSPYTHLARARQYFMMGRTASARDGLELAARRFPDNAEIRLEFGRTLAASGQTPAALQQLRNASDLQPAYADVQLELGCLLVRSRQPEAALGALKAALRLGAAPLRSHLCQGEALLLQGQFHPASEAYRAALAEEPNLPAASQNLAAALRRTGQHAERIRVLEAGVQRAPGDRELLSSLAFALATAPEPGLRQGQRALELAERATAGSGAGADALDARAAALAELQRFDAATTVAGQALESARATRPDLVAGLEARLEGYRARRPYRDP
jgi:4-amino-4-deoxy-L-arabinose transferase-like glycosyltransferase/Flp pilus assembly protein TadD